MNQTSTAFQKALSHDQDALDTFAWMREGHKTAFVGWIHAASSEPERLRRMRDAVDMLAGRDCVRRN